MRSQGELVRATYVDHTVTLETRLPYFSPGLLDEIETVLRSTPARGRGIVWLGCAGRGGVFHHGGDLGLMVDADECGIREYGQHCARLVEILLTHPHPTHALVNGDCFGGGLEGVLACGNVVVEPGVRIGFPEYRFGAFPGMGGRLFGGELELVGFGAVNRGEIMTGPLVLKRRPYLHPTMVFAETRQWVDAMMRAKSDPDTVRTITTRARLQRRLARSIRW